jgi:diacylglycerol kinase (ATP)
MGMPAATDQVDIVLLFGGDGTIHRHLRHLVQLAVPVLVVPAGSGNDFASSLGLRRVRDSVAAWDRFRNGGKVVRPIDLGTIAPLAGSRGGAAEDIRYFCCVAGVGIDGEVARRANAMPRWLRGHGGYFLSLLPTIFTFSASPMRVSASTNSNNSEWAILHDQPALVTAFANSPLYGGGMRVAPKANMDDGLLDVCIVDALHRLKLLTLFPTVYVGQHLSMREVHYVQTACARVETNEPLDVYADGEYVCQTPVEISIARDALQIVTL